MQNSCLSQANSLGKPENYTLIMHIMTCFEVPINLFGAYCILFKTPQKMESVKWSMLILHILSSSEDLFLSFFTIPVVYFPVIAGVPMGFLDFPVLQILGTVVLLGETGTAILSIFENRFYILFGQNTWWNQVRSPFLVINYLLTPISIIPIYLLIPEQGPALLEVQEILSCHPTSINDRNLFVVALNGTLFITVILFLTVTITSEVLFFGFMVLVKMLKQKRKISMSSRNLIDLQRKFIIALGLQTLIPLVLLILPIAYVAVSVAFNSYNQSLNNLVFCFLGAHGFLSTVIMLLVHAPYRHFTLCYQLISSKRKHVVQISSIGN